MVCQHSKLYNSWLNKVNWPFSSPVCLSALEARPPPLWLVEGSGRQTGGCNSALLQVCPVESCGVGVHQSRKGGSPDCFLSSHLLHLQSFHGICNLERMSESMISLYITVNEFEKVCRFVKLCRPMSTLNVMGHKWNLTLSDWRENVQTVASHFAELLRAVLPFSFSGEHIQTGPYGAYNKPQMWSQSCTPV